MDWSGITLGEFTRIGAEWALKISDTAVKTSIGDKYDDANVRLQTHVTSSGRLIGYTLKERRTRWLPIRLIRPSVLGLFYSGTDVEVPKMRKRIKVIYHDYHIRLLAFGRLKNSRDYMLVLRSKRNK